MFVTKASVLNTEVSLHVHVFQGCSLRGVSLYIVLHQVLNSLVPIPMLESKSGSPYIQNNIGNTSSPNGYSIWIFIVVASCTL